MLKPLLAAALGLMLPALLTFMPAIPAWLLLIVAVLSGIAFILTQYLSLKLVLISVLGFCFSLWGIQTKIENQLPLELERCDWHIQGSIVTSSGGTNNFQKFDFRVESAKLLSCPRQLSSHMNTEFLQGSLIRLNLYNASTRMSPGQRLLVKARLSGLWGLVGPGMFDYEAYLLTKGYVATGYIRNLELVLPAAKTSLMQLRFDISNWLQENKSLVNTGVFQALLVGDRSNVTTDQLKVLQRTGTVHLLVTSGLHISFAALLGAFCGIVLWLPLRLGTKHRWAAAGAIVFAWVYCGLAGFQMSTVRAATAVIAFSLATLLARAMPIKDRFLLSLCVILWLDPMAPLSFGFWLSFAAVLALLLLSLWQYKESRLQSKALLLVRAQICITLLLTPLLLHGQGDANLLSPLINLVAVPWLGLVILPTIMLAATTTLVGLTDSLWLFADMTISWLWSALFQVADISDWSVIGSSAPWLQWVSLSGAILLLLPLGNLRFPAITIWLTGLLFMPVDSGSIKRLVVLDVGQGLSVFFQTGSKAIVYDTGFATPGGYDSVSFALLPALRIFNVQDIPIAIISHGDADHAGGFSQLQRKFPQMAVFSGEPERIADGGQVFDCRRRVWAIDGVNFEIRRPEFLAKKSNDRSCTLHIQAAGFSILIPGDIGATSERIWLSQPGLHKAEVLIAPHHGSAGSSTTEFLQQVAPDWVVYSAGRFNRFRHPTPEACQRAKAVAAKLLNTAKHGAIIFEWDAAQKNNLRIKTWRCSKPPWWRKLEPEHCLVEQQMPLGLRLTNSCP